MTENRSEGEGKHTREENKQIKRETEEINDLNGSNSWAQLNYKKIQSERSIERRKQEGGKEKRIQEAICNRSVNSRSVRVPLQSFTFLSSLFVAKLEDPKS